jgi:hypothetical protein
MTRDQRSIFATEPGGVAAIEENSIGLFLDFYIHLVNWFCRRFSGGCGLA